MTKEAKAPTIYVIPDEADFEKEYYHIVYVFIYFNREYGFDRNNRQVEMDADPDEYNMEEVRLDNKRDHHWRMVFEEKTEGCTMRKRFYMLRCGVSTLGDR